MATTRQLVIGGFTVAAASGALLFIGNKARAFDKTSANVDEASESANKLFDAAGDTLSKLDPAVTGVANLVGDVARLGSGIVNTPRAVIGFGGRAGRSTSRAFKAAGRGTARGVTAVARGTGRAARGVARGGVKVATAPARAAGKVFKKIGGFF